MFNRVRLIWFFFKAIFSTDLDKVLKIDSQETQGQRKALSPAEQLKRFFEIYNVNVNDKIDYTNTHEHHHSNFKHKDEFNEELTEVVGLLYEEDGKTPKNAAEVFDMSYEVYEEYKKKILPIAKERTIKYEEIESFIEENK